MEEKQTEDCGGYLHVSKIPKHTTLNAEVLEKPIAVVEVITDITQLQLSKAIGQDGLTPFFYKTCCQILAPILACLYNSFTDSGQ